MDTPQVVPHSDLEVVGPKQRFSDIYQAQPFQAAQYEKHQGDLYDPSNLRNVRTICGLRPTTFFLLLALILVILAAAVGGGVGGSIALSNAKSANTANHTVSTTTVTATTSAATSPTSSTTSASTPTSSDITVPTTGTLALACPSISNTNQLITLGSKTWVFSITCGTDFDSISGSQIDILAIISYSLEDCAEACASYNLNYGQNICKGATFSRDLTNRVPMNFGTCWLKNNTDGAVRQPTNYDHAGLVLQ